MKKRITIFLLVSCLLAGCIAAFAACGEEQGAPESDPYSQYVFTLSEDGKSLTLDVGYKSRLTSGEIVLPESTYWYADAGSSVNTRHDTALPVSAIAAGAFESCGNITSVTIGGTYIDLSEDCFKNCKALKTVNISTLVTAIPSGAFDGCTALTTVTTGNDSRLSLKEVGDSAFKNCMSLNVLDADFASGSAIGEKAFYYTISLRGGTDLTNVATVGSEAFYGWLSTQPLTAPSVIPDGWAENWR